MYSLIRTVRELEKSEAALFIDFMLNLGVVSDSRSGSLSFSLRLPFSMSVVTLILQKDSESFSIFASGDEPKTEEEIEAVLF
jgi:hypothetical protein